MDEPVVAFDLGRMLLGDDPPLFLAEILVRTLIIYGWTLLLLRWVGGRSIAQLSIIEFLLVIALGSAVGDALFYPEVPLLHAMLVVAAVVGLDKLLDALIRRFRPVKLAVDGKAVAVMRDGRVLTEGVAARRIGMPELHALLRMNGIENLGEVRHAFLEADGQLSIFRAEPPRPGLAIVPPFEVAPPVPVAPGEHPCCLHCGRLFAPRPLKDEPEPCPDCGELRRTRVSLARSGDSCEPVADTQGGMPHDGREETEAAAAGLHAGDRGRALRR
ncbi:putative membrane protein [Rhodobacter sp. AKP1]|nr:putative membrane protein [Rhodobacter sp. AKP1]